ncbi:MAG TPA: PKD domain-containing protein, partial [Phnomibacter sp.]|nr:PKD domain-containing protein [Phnomibacter sp.]
MKYGLINTIRKCLLLIGSMLLAWPLLAAHLKGGYIEYEYLGPVSGNNSLQRYRVTVYQYLDCSSTGGQVDNDVFLGVYREGSPTIVSQQTVGLAGTNIISKGSFTCINNPPQVCYRIDKYVAEIELPNSPTPYILTVQRCCRIANIVNVPLSSGTGVTYTATIRTNDAGGLVLANSSPEFVQKDTALVCASNTFTLPFEAIDKDGDSLVYNFTSGLNTPSREAKPNPPLAPPFPGLSYAGSFSAQQPLGDKVTINRTNGVISGIAPDFAGDYVVAVMVEEYRKGLKIGEARKELHISVGNCDIPRAALPDRIINCDNNTVFFQNQSTSSAITSYFWDFGLTASAGDTSNQATPSFTFPDTGVYKVKLVTNRNAFCPDSAETLVSIFPGFNPAFNIDGVCQQLPYQFSDATTARYGVVNKWNWDFGDPATTADRSTLRNPSYKYPAAATVTVTFSVETSKGCADTLTRDLAILDKPVVQLAFKDTLICSIDSLQLRASGSGTFTWTPASNIINANTATPVVFPKDTITYYVTLTDRGCVGTDSVKVNVLDFITVDAGNDTTICRTDGIVLRPVTEALSFNWQPATVLSNPAIRNPLATPVDSLTTFYVNANLGKCQARDSIRIRTVPYPVAFAGNDTTICYADAVVLRGSGDGAFARWTPAAAIANANAYSTSARPVSSTTYTLTVTDNRGCPKAVTDEVVVTVRPRITLNAGNDTTVVYNQTLQFNAATNASQIRWSPATALSNPNIANP